MSQEAKRKVEQKRVRGRNMHDVVNQIVEKYNKSEGWALVKVVSNVVNLEVILERAEIEEAVLVELPETEVNLDETKETEDDVLAEEKETKLSTKQPTKATKATKATEKPVAKATKKA